MINEERRNSKFFMNIVKFPENVYGTSDLKEAVDGADIILCCIPVQQIENVLRDNKEIFIGNSN